MGNNSAFRHHKITGEYFSHLASARGVNKENNADKYDVIGNLLLPVPQGKEVLECGGGAGFYTRKLLEDGYAVTTVDLSGKALEVNRRNAEKCGKGEQLKTYEGDFNDFCHRTDNKFDQILFLKVLHHFDTLNEIYRALDYARRVCRPGGRIIIFEPNGRNRLWKWYLAMIKDRRTGKSKWFYEQNMRYTTATNFKAYAEKNTIDAVVRHHYIIPAFIMNRFQNRILVALNRRIEESALHRWAFNISVVIDC